MQTVILAGGLATRLHPTTLVTPKSMVTVNGRPFLQHQLELLQKNDCHRIVLCVGHMGDKIEAYFGDGSRFGVSISYSYDGDSPLGTGGALVRAKRLLEEEFFVLFGDSFLLFPYAEIAQAFRNSGLMGLMVVYRNEDRFDRSNVDIADGLIQTYQPGVRRGTLPYIDAGLKAFRKTVLERRRDGEVLDLREIVTELVNQNQLAAFETPQRFYEIGSHQGLSELRTLMSSGIFS